MHSTPSAPAAIAARAPRTWPSISVADVLVRPSPAGRRGRRARDPGRAPSARSRPRAGRRSLQVIELRDEHGAVLVDRVDDAPQRGHEALVVVAVVLRRHAAVRQHGQRLHHDQPGAAGGACRVVIACTLARHVVLSERDCVRGEDDAARAAACRADSSGGEQQREARVHGLRAPFSGSGGGIIR